MRGAGDQQHTQVFANAFNQRDSVVVGGGDLAIEFADRKFDDVLAAARQLEVEGNLLPRRRSFGGYLFAVDPHGYIDGRTGGGAILADLINDLLIFANNAEAGAAHHIDAAVPFIGVANDQAVQRGVQPQCGERSRHVMDLSVGDHHGAGKPGAGDIANPGVQGFEQPRRRRLRVGVGFGFDDPGFECRISGDALGQCFQCGTGAGGAIRAHLARAAVDNDGDNTGHRLTVFEIGDRVGQRQHKG